MRLIGDVHGKFDCYLNLLNCEKSVQVGDFGIGFNANIDLALHEILKDKPQHRFIRGNHDNFEACLMFNNFILDGTIEDNILFIGGAESIDRSLRTPGYDYWPDEEVSIAQQYQIMNQDLSKVEILVTHDFPQFVVQEIIKDPLQTQTGLFFDTVFETVKPKLWVAGHHHVDFDREIQGCRFVCLPELSYIDI